MSNRVTLSHFFQEFLHSGNMTDAGPQDQIDDNENDQESVSLPGVLHGKPAMGEGGGGAPTKLFNMWSFVLLFVVVL